jgi:hypothetical protein
LTKRLEESISHIGAKVANAAELLRQGNVLSAHSAALLVGVQQELEELYMTLDSTSMADERKAED